MQPIPRQDSPAPRPAQAVFLMTIGFALLAGGLELSIRLVQKSAWGTKLENNANIGWMTPLAYVLLVLFPAMMAYVVLRFIPGLGLARVGFVLGVWPCWVSVLWSVFSRLQGYAVWLLGLGLSVQMSVWVWKRLPRVYGLARVWVLIASSTIVIYGLGLQTWRVWAESRELSRLPSPPPDAPNVLLVVWDTVRARNLGAYGYDRPTTPNLDRLVKDSVVFENAIAPAPWTLPTHASLFTGRWPYELSAGWQAPLDKTTPTLAEVLKQHGYATAGFAANYIYTTYEEGVARGFIHYDDYGFSLGHLIQSCALGRTYQWNRWLRRKLHFQDVLGRKSGGQVNREVLDWFSTRPRRPYFVFLNYFDAHQPYVPPPPFDTQFMPNTPRVYMFNWLDDQNPKNRGRLQAELNHYDATIAYMDHCLGQLIESLRSSGDLDNTVIVLTSDHGEQFADNSPLCDHGNSLYTALLHVPLIIYDPARLPKGLRVKDHVCLRDVAATVLDVLGLSGTPQPLPGRSLTRFWGGRGAADEPPIVSHLLRGVRMEAKFKHSGGDMWSALFDGWHYIVNGDDTQELYNVTTDPWEKQDLIADPGNAARVESLRQHLDSVREGR